MRESVALCVICTVHVFVWVENSTSTIHACIENRNVVTAVYNFQATIGVCSTKKPGAFDFVARAKWNAWSSLGDLSKVGIVYLSFLLYMYHRKLLLVRQEVHTGMEHTCTFNTCPGPNPNHCPTSCRSNSHFVYHSLVRVGAILCVFAFICEGAPMFAVQVSLNQVS